MQHPTGSIAMLAPAAPPPWADARLAANGVAVRDNFAVWFADSRARGADGAPQVYFHGTDADFDAFDVAQSRPGAAFGPGIYLTENPVNTAWKPGPGAQVMALYVRVLRPFDIRTELSEAEAEGLRGVGIAHACAGKPAPLISMERRFGSISAAARAAGFDGLLHYGPGGQRHLLVFDASAVKSAIGNSGMFLDSPSLCDRVDASEEDDDGHTPAARPRMGA